jgi:hypothetical protein
MGVAWRELRDEGVAAMALGTVQLARALPLLVVLAASASAEEAVQYTGHIQSVRPVDAMLLIEEVGADDGSDLLYVRIRGADVVRTWRDPGDPRRWRERETSIYRWPVGTFVVVTGRATGRRSVQASRVEIPKIASE